MITKVCRIAWILDKAIAIKVSNLSNKCFTLNLLMLKHESFSSSTVCRSRPKTRTLRNNHNLYIEKRLFVVLIERERNDDNIDYNDWFISNKLFVGFSVKSFPWCYLITLTNFYLWIYFMKEISILNWISLLIGLLIVISKQRENKFRAYICKIFSKNIIITFVSNTTTPNTIIT